MTGCGLGGGGEAGCDPKVESPQIFQNKNSNNNSNVPPVSAQSSSCIVRDVSSSLAVPPSVLRTAAMCCSNGTRSEKYSKAAWHRCRRASALRSTAKRQKRAH